MELLNQLLVNPHYQQFQAQLKADMETGYKTVLQYNVTDVATFFAREGLLATQSEQMRISSWFDNVKADLEEELNNLTKKDNEN